MRHQGRVALNRVGNGVSDQALLLQLEAAVRQVAAAEVLPRFQRVSAQTKPDGSLLTEADLACQAALAAVLPTLAPCPVLGEEMTEAEQKSLWAAHADGLWIVDPIDGTTNFARGMPGFGVSVALFRQGRPVLAVILLPVLNECYTALLGQGAWCNGQPLHLPEDAVSLAQSVVAVEPKWLPPRLRQREFVPYPCHSSRNVGAATLDWCWLAAGRIDVMLHGAQKLWDYAAGVLIAQEAGASVAGLSCADFWQEDLWLRPVVAARTAPLLREWQGWLRDCN